MKRLAGRQAAFVNKQEARSGALWEGRFKASPIQRDNYLLACCRYIEMNPVRANMVVGPGQYRWSSYRERIGQVNRGLLDFDACYLALSDDDNRRIECYQTYLNLPSISIIAFIFYFDYALSKKESISIVRRTHATTSTNITGYRSY